ncbi:MAG: diadenylate cyclase CdaA [Eubacterium sp.]|nr:diadenylate cyclase CdaA [Eubacterium sp.]
MFHNIYNFFDKYFAIPNIYISDIIEIVIISIAVYYIILWFRKSRAWVLMKGLILLFIFMFIASVFHFTTLLWIINKALGVGIIAMVIIFQPELRRALEALGRKNKLFKVFRFAGPTYEERFSDKTLDNILNAVKELAQTKTGALIVIQQDFDLIEFVETGIRLDAKVTSQLLINIFEKNTPLHDGAVIIDGDEIVAATCYLPMSENLSLSKELGTRHRAAVGLSEIADCLVIVVSEETGGVSLARDGKLIRFADQPTITSELLKSQDKELVKSGKIFKKGSDRNVKGQQD